MCVGSLYILKFHYSNCCAHFKHLCLVNTFLSGSNCSGGGGGSISSSSSSSILFLDGVFGQKC
jgi:hypothetical protein